MDPKAADALAGEVPVAAPADRALAAAGPELEPNWQAAYRQLRLSPQEQYLYQQHLENLAAGGVPNEGQLSTLFATTIEVDGRHYVIPTVWPSGSGRLEIVDADRASMLAAQAGLANFPSYGSQKEAEARYGRMHEYMERDFSQPSVP
jgi:hypothetical protein